VDARDEDVELRPFGRTGTVWAAVGTLLAVAGVLVSLDQWTKNLIVAAAPDGERILGGLVYLDLAYNKGAAFSFGSGFTWVFPVVAIVISSVILWLSRSLRSWPWAVALGLVLGGAVGNLIDRLFREPGPFRGAVVDFISLFAPGGEKFAIFNVADSALTVGIILAISLEVFGVRRDGYRAMVRRKPADGESEAS
jgi:signal peptidase II